MDTPGTSPLDRPLEELSLSELLERRDRRHAAATATARRLEAELAILLAFDWRRSAAGHDYGHGRRADELMRRRRELEDLRRGDLLGTDVVVTTEPGLAGLAVSGYGDELRAAWARVAAPRIRRLEAQPDGGGTARTIRVWARTRAEFERALGHADRA